MRYDEIFPYLKKGALLSKDTCPANWLPYLEMADANSFNPKPLYA